MLMRSIMRDLEILAQHGRVFGAPVGFPARIGPFPL
jgi:hypothetical protein